jgi:hypothetical protein
MQLPKVMESYSKLSDQSSTNGTSFQMYLGAVTTKAMTEVFGAPDADADWDPERGYDGDEWAFKGPGDSVFNVYARWGSFRVGAHGAEGVEAFGAWLFGKLGLEGAPKLASHWVSPIGTVIALGGES